MKIATSPVPYTYVCRLLISQREKRPSPRLLQCTKFNYTPILTEIVMNSVKICNAMTSTRLKIIDIFSRIAFVDFSCDFHRLSSIFIPIDSICGTHFTHFSSIETHRFASSISDVIFIDFHADRQYIIWYPFYPLFKYINASFFYR